MTEKRCTRCGQTQPLSNYHRDKYTKDGLTQWCKECKRLANAAAYAPSPNPQWQVYSPEGARTVAEYDATLPGDLAVAGVRIVGNRAYFMLRR